MEVTTPKSLSSAQLRKIKKPMIERRRRERINDSLNQLKTLLLEAMDKDESRHSKMEKADILELAVDYLKTTQVNNARCSATQQVNESGPSIAKYQTGFQACAEEVGRYFGKLQGVNPMVTSRLTNHLSACLHMRQATSFPVGARPVADVIQQQSQQQQQQIPESTPVTSLPGSANTMPLDNAMSQPPQALPLYITTTGQMYGLHVISPTLTVCQNPGQNELVPGLVSPVPVSPSTVNSSSNTDSHNENSSRASPRFEGPEKYIHQEENMDSKEQSRKQMWQPWRSMN